MIPPFSRRSALFFCIANFLFWAGLYLYVPILPVHVQSSGASLYLVGTVVAAYAIPQVLLRIPIGIWSDSLGRHKPLVAIGIVVASLGALGLGLSANPGLMFLSRMTTGIGAAAWVVFAIYFTSYYPPEDSGKAMGLINFVQGGALVAATAGGGAIADVLGSQPTFFIAALLGASALFALLFSKEHIPSKAKPVSWKDFSAIATRPVLITVSIMGILFQFSIYAGLFGFVPVYAAQIGASHTDLGLITTINLGCSSAGSLVSIWLSDRLGYRATIIWSALLISGSLFAIPFILQVPALMALQVSYGLGRGILMTILMTLSIRDVPHEHRATAMGVFQAVYAIGMLAGPLVSGFLGDRLGLSSVFSLAASISLLVAVLAFLPVFSRRRSVLPNS
ncbi:MAG: MFS transporter [Dehalococcoidales bacterium]